MNKWRGKKVRNAGRDENERQNSRYGAGYGAGYGGGYVDRRREMLQSASALYLINLRVTSLNVW